MSWGALLRPKDTPIWTRDCTSTAACVTGGPICARPFLVAARRADRPQRRGWARWRRLCIPHVADKAMAIVALGELNIPTEVRNDAPAAPRACSPRAHRKSVVRCAAASFLLHALRSQCIRGRDADALVGEWGGHRRCGDSDKPGQQPLHGPAPSWPHHSLLNVVENVSLSEELNCPFPMLRLVEIRDDGLLPRAAFRISCVPASPRAMNSRMPGPVPACTAAWGMLHDPHTSIFKVPQTHTSEPCVSLQQPAARLILEKAAHQSDDLCCDVGNRDSRGVRFVAIPAALASLPHTRPQVEDKDPPRL
ncbi:hypothetical protein PSPO01_13987 [Paraphaeosphaeria sporulosa]